MTVTLLTIVADWAYYYIACSPRPRCAIACGAIADAANFVFRVTYPMPIAHAQGCARTYDFLAVRACITIITFTSECVIHVADTLTAAPLFVTTQRDRAVSSGVPTITKASAGLIAVAVSLAIVRAYAHCTIALRTTIAILTRAHLLFGVCQNTLSMTTATIRTTSFAAVISIPPRFAFTLATFLAKTITAASTRAESSGTVMAAPPRSAVACTG